MLINKQAGSFFFLGELLTNLPLNELSTPENHCGDCNSCISLCPTQAIEAPYLLNASKCISYLTIEHFGSIDESLRPLIGNRIYGCDDCQLVCPWNRYAQTTQLDDFQPRNNFDDIELIELMQWTETEFLKNTEGSPIRRIGFERWQRNIAIALGNAPYNQNIVSTLQQQLEGTESDLVKEHIEWALEQQMSKPNNDAPHSKKQQKLLRTTQKLLKHLDDY